MAGKEIIMADKKYLIEINHVGKKFGDLTVLKDISIKVKEKEVVVIIGPSGSGKSTLLRCINGLEKPTSGNVFFDGMPVNGEKNINEVRTEVGMVFQRFNLFPHMTVIQNLMLAPMKVRKISKKEAYDRGMSLLRKVGLEDKADYKPSQLSGGQQQRSCIARALAVQPEVLLMDEPTSALDPISTSKIEELMEDLKKKAEEQSFLKSRFLASVSHDLRSPLHAIIGGSDILKRQNLPDESKNILEYIRVAGNNLLEQVDTILAYSKLEAGMLTLKNKK